jgi:hypothetical protein
MSLFDRGVIDPARFRHNLGSIILSIGLPLIFIAVILALFPFRDRFQFDGDEGIELMKSMLVLRGYPLYEQIWSDQPPGFTYVLAMVFRVFPLEVNVGRLTVLASSAALLWACWQIVSVLWGKVHALAGVGLTLLLPYYLSLSVSVMAGLPALTLAMFSLLAIMVWHIRREPVYLVLSGFALSGSVSIKLFTVFLAPILLFGILVGEFSHWGIPISIRKILLPALLWGGVFLASLFVVLIFGVGFGNLDQLIGSHLGAAHTIQQEIFTINYHLRDSMPMLFLAFLGIVFAFLRKRWLTFYLVAWGLTAYLMLTSLSPVWYHHQLLVTLPAATLAGVALGEMVSSIVQIRRRRGFHHSRMILSAITFVGFLLVLYDQLPEILPELEIGANRSVTGLRASQIKGEAYQIAQKYAPETHWMMTNLPMYAFRLGLPIPPNVAVLSTKRLRSEQVEGEELLNTLQTFNPEQVLIRSKLPGIDRYLDEHYQLVYTRRDINVYIRNDLYDRHK